MSEPILSPRARVPPAQADTLLRCYAERIPPKEAARKAGLSLNTVYEQYTRIRWRLILARYYRDGALSIDAPHFEPELRAQLRRRRGLGPDNIFAHAAEALDWYNEWPSGLVLRHLRKIIALTGPLDVPPDLSPPQQNRLRAYVRYARAQLIHHRAQEKAEADETWQPFLERTTTAVEAEWRNYRTASKQVERSEPPGRKKRLVRPRKSQSLIKN
ncbi:hypothetical protein [Amorphus sp. 3PC139-8]|uniref:hypothetical protein n=1 Tax=Amorphus sp. 3PC139-8 TaxID=2735676 RepID=UPI00345D933E